MMTTNIMILLSAAVVALTQGIRVRLAFLPPPTSRKRLRLDDFGVVAGDHKARLRPATGRGRALRCMSLSHTRNEFFTLYIINNLN